MAGAPIERYLLAPGNGRKITIVGGYGRGWPVRRLQCGGSGAAARCGVAQRWRGSPFRPRRHRPVRRLDLVGRARDETRRSGPPVKTLVWADGSPAGAKGMIRSKAEQKTTLAGTP